MRELDAHVGAHAGFWSKRDASCSRTSCGGTWALAVPGTPFERLAQGRPGFPTVLGRALNRFEAGLERNVVVEALNDHLLALRFLLEGGGPADLGISMRVAALCAEPDGRAAVKLVVDRAIGDRKSVV